MAAGAAPGAVLAVSVAGDRRFHAAGRIGNNRRTRPDQATIYDLASLTKVVALTTLTMMAVEEHRIDLDTPVVRYLPRFAPGGKTAVTIRMLLAHASGLPAHRPLWREAPDADSAVALVLATPLDAAPTTRTLYSDLGVIALGQVIEGVYEADLATLAQRRIFGPLRMTATRYRPPAAWRERIAPTEYDTWRGRLVHGEVHDENAAFLGGVSGHAGLFSSATDLLTFGEWLLRRSRDAPATKQDVAMSASTIREFTRRQQIVAGSSRALGWDTPSPGSSAGTRLAVGSFGHTGFTGTSIWIDPSRRLVIVLLSNRVHPTRDNVRLAPLRGLVADRVVEVLEARLR